MLVEGTPDSTVSEFGRGFDAGPTPGTPGFLFSESAKINLNPIKTTNKTIMIKDGSIKKYYELLFKTA
ncbi:MAG: hypothetical protein F3742_05685 [Nitrospinae bacterium]|nr:hypothetical protein [Nitrospinota bacterium]